MDTFQFKQAQKRNGHHFWNLSSGSVFSGIAGANFKQIDSRKSKQRIIKME